MRNSGWLSEGGSSGVVSGATEKEKRNSDSSREKKQNRNGKRERKRERKRREGDRRTRDPRRARGKDEAHNTQTSRSISYANVEDNFTKKQACIRLSGLAESRDPDQLAVSRRS